MLYRKYFKRLFDIVCAIAAVIVFCWLYIIIAVLVRIKLGSPVIFSQERVGKDDRIFRIYKFRTMSDERDVYGELLSDEQRLGKFGLMLRRLSLDEIPEAFNILKGDMSVVGPRPLLTQYLPLYNERQRRRHEVRPGLSGLSQINGRNAIFWEQKFEYDIEYIETVNFWMDIKIIAATVKKAFVKTDGIAYEGDVTMPVFVGTQEKEAQHV